MFTLTAFVVLSGALIGGMTYRLDPAIAEPYNAKRVRYAGEKIVRKEGKTVQ